MNNTYLKKIAPYVLGLLILFLVNYIYFLPQFQGKQVLQGDIVSYTGAYGEIGKYWAEKGEQLFWTNAMFGGMPTFMIGVSLKSFYLDWVPRLLSFDIYYPMGVFLAQMIAFFIMTSVMGIHPLIGIIGSIAFGFTTNNFVLFEAGHNSKLGTIVFNPLVIAGLYTIYKHKKYLLGGVLFSVATANSLNANHPQMTFYFVITCVVLALVWLVESIKEKEITHLLKTIATVIIGASISLAATSSTWLMALDYSKDSLRGKPILTEESAVNINSTEASNNAPSSEAAGESGLGWDYAMMWSNKTQDLLSVLIPFAAGGSSGETTKEGATFKLLVDNGAKTNEDGKMGLPFYWGGLPFTSGPNYLGAVMIFLFTFGFFIEKGGLRWWALISVLLTLFLSMGQHFEPLQRLFFDFVPFYNKFRAPSSILTITPFFLPILGLFAINKLCYQKYSPDNVKKALIYSFSIIGGLTLFLALFATSFFDFKGPSDGQLQPIVLTNIIKDRIDFFKADAFRSFYFIGASAIAIFLFTKNWIKPTILISALGFLTLLDHWTVGQRYLGKSSFDNVETMETPLVERPADKEISSLEKSRGDYRVLDLAVSTFGNSTTSFYHNTIGGYHAAKLMRYNDIIEKQISNNNQRVINMLNAKYIIKQDQTVSQNPLACGTAWFIDTIRKVSTPNEEMAALNSFNPQEEAIILDNEFNGYAGNFDPQKGGEISLTQYDPQNLVYSYTAASPQFAVFSEIWYGPDKGWQAFIDDKPVDHVRVNYLLRGLKVPEGKHTIDFRFKPVKIQQYITISRAASGLLMVALLGMIGWMGFNFYKNPGEPNPFPSAPERPVSPVSRDAKPAPKTTSVQQNKKTGKKN
jgi:hypothetical protein